MPYFQPRRFSTNARVHPRLLPYVLSSRASGIKWIPPVLAMVTIGYGVLAWKQTRTGQRLAERERSSTERRQHYAALMDAYGHRERLEDLEQAMQVYEVQRRSE